MMWLFGRKTMKIWTLICHERLRKSKLWNDQWNITTINLIIIKWFLFLFLIFTNCRINKFLSLGQKCTSKNYARKNQWAYFLHSIVISGWPLPFFWLDNCGLNIAGILRIRLIWPVQCIHCKFVWAFQFYSSYSPLLWIFFGWSCAHPHHRQIKVGLDFDYLIKLIFK